jgi:integrase
MATLNLTLDTRRARKDGTYPLVFRLRVEDKFCDIGTDYKIFKEQFDKKTNSIIQDIESSIQLEQLKAHYLKRLRSYLAENLGCNDIKSIKTYLVNKQPTELTIIEFWNKQIESLLTSGRYGNAKIYTTCLSVVSQSIDLNVSFSKLNYQSIIDLESKLFKRGLSVNGISVYMRTFRAICNKAINYDIVSYEWYPFRKFKIRKEKTTPRVITITEMKRYFHLDLKPSDPLYKSWLIGKLIFMLRGINIKDLLLLSSNNIKGGRIIYKRAKTGRIYSIEILPVMQEIFDQLKTSCTLVGVLSDFDLKKQAKLVDIIVQRRKVINVHLKKLGLLINSNEPLSTYVFRYSYANILKQLGYSKDLIAEALGHEYGNSVTGIYLEQFDNEIVDEMNSRGIDSVLI